MIIDSNCPLEYEPISSNLKKIIERAAKNNIKYLLSISTTDESYEKIELDESFPKYILDNLNNYKNWIID